MHLRNISGSHRVNTKLQNSNLIQVEFALPVYLDHSDSASLYLTAPVAGKYKIRISGHAASGGYALRYQSVKPAMVSVRNSTSIELSRKGCAFKSVNKKLQMEELALL